MPKNIEKEVLGSNEHTHIVIHVQCCVQIALKARIT